MIVHIYDTTLRDGTQGEGMSLSVDDKLKIAQRLDQLGVSYIEGGWPGSNPKDIEFFRRVGELNLEFAKVAAFGSTRKAGVLVSEDANVKALIDSGAPVTTIVGKAWDFHVLKALETTLDENIAMVRDTVKYLKDRQLEVVFDAEHYFDGFKSNEEYALQVCLAAQEAGADWIVLCDTNGGCMTWEIEEITRKTREAIDIPLGIHVHNDGGCAIANSMAAIRCGCTQVHGTMNGYGERCGNADLAAIIPNLELKMKLVCLPPGRLKRLTETSRYISEVANLPHANNQPYVGHAAFAHKGGIHVSALLKNSLTYEHISPELVGNNRRVLVSELSGVSNLLYKARELDLDVNMYDATSRQIIKEIKELENEGFQFEGAEASLELLLTKAFGQHHDFFQLENLKIIVEKRENSGITSEAIIKLRVNDQMVHTAAEGDGPVNAVDNALRKALLDFYPSVDKMHLSDYKVRVLDGTAGTSARVRVLSESTSGTDKWSTLGVSENIIEASWQALVDSLNYLLMKEGQERKKE